ncbi:MAG: hemoglobin-like flavoprotein [Myxococcota bacterium]|jgi:hemoglobin-like flavoprotein
MTDAATLISEARVQLVERTFAVLKAGGLPVLTARFYAVFFERHPSYQSLFSPDEVTRGSKLAVALSSIVVNLRSQAGMAGLVTDLAHAHDGRGIAVQAYADWGSTVADVVVDLAAPAGQEAAVRDAWNAAIGLVSSDMQGVRTGH